MTTTTKRARAPKDPRQKLVGKTAWLRDICCAPKQSGACRIIAVSSKGPEYVVIEWTQSDFHQTAGEVRTMKLTDLDIR